MMTTTTCAGATADGAGGTLPPWAAGQYLISSSLLCLTVGGAGGHEFTKLEWWCSWLMGWLSWASSLLAPRPGMGGGSHRCSERAREGFSQYNGVPRGLCFISKPPGDGLHNTQAQVWLGQWEESSEPAALPLSPAGNVRPATACIRQDKTRSPHRVFRTSLRSTAASSATSAVTSAESSVDSPSSPACARSSWGGRWECRLSREAVA
jgi:hypothetical protein